MEDIAEKREYFIQILMIRWFRAEHERKEQESGMLQLKLQHTAFFGNMIL